MSVSCIFPDGPNDTQGSNGRNQPGDRNWKIRNLPSQLLFSFSSDRQGTKIFAAVSISLLDYSSSSSHIKKKGGNLNIFAYAISYMVYTGGRELPHRV